MAKQLKLRRGTTAEHNTFTGAIGEVTVDTDKKVLVVHDETTQGGHPLIKATDVYIRNEVDNLIETAVSNIVTLSGVTPYHLLSGNLAVDNTVITAGMATTLYTGNGATQSVVTGVDMATQWGNDASEQFGGLVWIKSRSSASYGNYLQDTLRGTGVRVETNSSAAEVSLSTAITSFNNDGFSLGNYAGDNTNLATYVAWVFQTTHRVSGVTNHGKAYTCHYNPFTGFTMVKYEGSGIAGHEIPHHLGRELGFVTIKGLDAAVDWGAFIASSQSNQALRLNLTNALENNTLFEHSFNDTSFSLNAVWGSTNTSANQYIMYGWADSYFDEANTLIGNYEIGTYTGTFLAGNKVTTRGKPAWVMIKRLDSVGDWFIVDNQRGTGLSTATKYLNPNASFAEGSSPAVDMVFSSDGFTIGNATTSLNALGGQYLYMIVYDNDTGSGKSKYPKATDSTNVNLNNALVPFAKGIDSYGTIINTLTKNETVSGLSLVEGKNYVYCDALGNYGSTNIAPSYGKDNPSLGDFYDVLENKWYTSGDVEIINSRNYLDAIVYADAGGQPTYIEQLPKVEYKDSLNVTNLNVEDAIIDNLTVGGSSIKGTAYDVDTTSFIENTLASGAIIERGSNANGEYIKFADGTLIHTGKYVGQTTQNLGGTANIATFSHTFIDTNIKTAFSEETFGLNCKLTFGSQTTTYIFPNMRTSTGVGVAIGTVLPTYNLIAIGRWK